MGSGASHDVSSAVSKASDSELKAVLADFNSEVQQKIVRALEGAAAPVYQSHHFDSEKWKQVKSRDDDIIIVTAYKSGTTWMQQIVSEILFQGKEKPGTVGDLSPWVDLRVPPMEVLAPGLEAQTHRRFLKTHLPADAFRPYYNPRAKYIYVGRDGRDAFMSLMNHWEKANDAWYGALNEAPGRAGPPIPKYQESGTIPEIFDRWLSQASPGLEGETDGFPFWSLFKNVKTWWELGHQNKNVLFVHFNNMKKGLDGEMVRIGKFLGVEIPDQLLPKMVHACTFDEMHKNANTVAPLNGALWEGGGKSFVFKGTNSRWVGVLNDAQVKVYQEKAVKELSPECAKWLETGELLVDA
jgi:aryl sulfotransferase